MGFYLQLLLLVEALQNFKLYMVFRVRSIALAYLLLRTCFESFSVLIFRLDEAPAGGRSLFAAILPARPTFCLSLASARTVH